MCCRQQPHSALTRQMPCIKPQALKYHNIIRQRQSYTFKSHPWTTQRSVSCCVEQHDQAAAAPEAHSASDDIIEAVVADSLAAEQYSIHTVALEQERPHNQQPQEASSSNITVSSLLEASTLTPEAVAAANEETSAVNRVDIYKAIAISGTFCVLAGILDHDWVDAHQGLSMTLLFGLGYLGIFVEEVVGLNKAAVALVMAVSLWTIYSDGAGGPVDAQLTGALSSVAELILFLLGAMTVVEVCFSTAILLPEAAGAADLAVIQPVVDSHGGFKRLAAWVKADKRQNLTWFVALLTFCMSAVLDNLTTTIVMVAVLQRAVPDNSFRKVLGAVVVVAANAGGACCVIGDLTTTMLWIHGQITPWATLRDLFLPSLVSLAVPVAVLCSTNNECQGPVIRTSHALMQGQQLPSQTADGHAAAGAMQGASNSWSSSTSSATSVSASVAAADDLQLEVSNRDVLVLAVGVGALLFVPIFKHLTGLPPYMGILSGLGILWMVCDALHFGESKQYPKVQDALRNLDIAGVMFFLGILLSVEALNAAGLLQLLAVDLNKAIPDANIIAAAIGVASAVIDNVPLVAATMGMYDVAQVPQDSQLWQLIALCAGTGGSLLVIGSAAGVAYMGLEGVGFGWYLRNITPWVFLGYCAANACYLGLHELSAAVW